MSKNQTTGGTRESFEVGQVVKVLEGSLTGVIGTVVEVIDPIRAIRVNMVAHKKNRQTFTLYASELKHVG